MTLMKDLFGDDFHGMPRRQDIASGATVLRAEALAMETSLLNALSDVIAAASFRHMITPGGFTMSVAITNCGQAGWISDRGGYRYSTRNPETGAPWPAMPDAFLALAQSAAEAAGYPNFLPDACLINRYEPGARLSLHQDKNERDFTHPIVSVSLGLPATFQFGGLERTDKLTKIALNHGDVVVWGGSSRLCYHGVLALKDGEHPKLGRVRHNLTFRKAL